ncbi:uncharacterized protein LOC116302972 [Actinia tenebrosa]|uniref:Uncharacterized protein LOC116302972 n=1 Tax=Actinia tenebrosa TaxID=6105 RepID=A0A6P8IPH8_ACTTE|nr:uncharacterized protein LOC116302972 [Actinia tenebrosa]
MRKFNSKVKKRARKPQHSRARGHSQHNDESNLMVPESSIKNARIRSAIENGSRIPLPSDTKGLNLSKFEHVGKEGPLVVYAQDKKMFNEFGHFTVITSFKPSDSLRNQLFFASEPVSEPSKYENLTKSAEIKKDVRSKKDVIREATTTSANTRLLSQKARQTRRQPNSFEDLVKRYKDRQEKYFHSLGDESLYLFQKIDRMCKAGKREVDTNIPFQDEDSHDPKNNVKTTIQKKDKMVFPKIMAHKPGVKTVHIEIPKPQSNQVAFKDKTKNKLPSI